jgi:hypothetical protein
MIHQKRLNITEPIFSAFRQNSQPLTHGYVSQNSKKKPTIDEDKRNTVFLNPANKGYQHHSRQNMLSQNLK